MLGWAALGLTCAAAVLTRPEGALYVGSLFLALAWHFRGTLWERRARGLWLAGLSFALPVSAFSSLLWRRFGILWPAGWTNVAGPQFLATNLRLVLRQDLPSYAAAAGLPAPAWSGLLVAVALVLVVAMGLWRLCRTRPILWCVPLACLLNLAVIFDSPSYLTPDLFSPSTFFRHISVMFPWLLPAIAVLMPKDEGRTTKDEMPADEPLRPSSLVLRQRVVSSALAVGAAGLLIWELAILGSSATANQAGRPTVLTSDIYVLVSDLWRADDTLPVLPFTRDAAGTAAVNPAFDYMSFRARLFGAVRPYDLHVNDAARAHQIAIGVVALAGLGALLVARRTSPPGPSPARRGGTTLGTLVGSSPSPVGEG
jgi:hypothetical protein